MKKEILNIKFDDFQAIISVADGKAELWWTDYVANEWSEDYDSVAIALTRLALLVECDMAEWNIGFITTPKEHVAEHNAFALMSVA